LNGNGALFAAIDLGGTRIRSAIAHEPARLERRDECDTPSGARNVIEALASSIRGVATDVRAITAIGVSAPGPLDHRTGLIHEAPNIPGFRDVPLGADLSRDLGRPVFVDRDTVVAAIGEALFGAAREARDFVYVTISTGIGGAIVADGRLIRGTSGTAGEIGHWPVDPDGPRCGCGANGCIESIASGSAIARAFGANGADDVFAAARRRDERAITVLRRASRALGDMAVGLVNLLNPALIVVGGGVAIGEPDFVYGAMRDAVRERAFAVPAAAVRIVPAELGDDAGLVGALAMARERVAGREPLA
jgi:glucokinase